MPSWYVHIQAAAETLEKLNGRRPPGSPLTRKQAAQLHKAGHDHRNYLAAGALGPDLFFLLPDFKGDVGRGLLGLVSFALDAWKTADEAFVEQWETWMGPVLDQKNQLADSISGGMLGEIAQVQTILGGTITNMVLSFITSTNDLFGKLTSGTQAGYADSAFFWSDAFHYRKTYAFARRLYQNALLADTFKTDPTEPSRIPKQQAFALGWMSHCATDVAGHPFTNAKTGGPYRIHWQRHHVVENHMDAFVYSLRHGDPSAGYESLDTSALHFRLAFQKTAGTAPDDAPSNRDWFPASWTYPPYPQGERDADRNARKQVFDVDSEPLPAHLCELLIKTMKEVYGGPDDKDGPQVLAWDGPTGRPTVGQLQDMFDVAYTYVKMSTSAGLAPRMPQGSAPVITDHDLPTPPGFGADDSAGANPNDMRELNVLDVLLAILAFALWLVELSIWLATTAVSVLTNLATWPAREAIHELLVVPAWSLYMLSRNPLVMQGFLAPKPEEIDLGLVVLGRGSPGALAQLRADLAASSGFAPLVPMMEPSGLDAQRGASTQGFGVDSAYPRALLTDLDPPFTDRAPIDAPLVPSEFVAPWRYPEANLSGRRNGWEAPRTHVGPYLQGQNAGVLMGNAPGTDAARRRYEEATTPAETEAVSAELMPQGRRRGGEELGDPIDYGAYLMGQLTGEWTGALDDDPGGYTGRDDQRPLPDFNLDSDRGYAYQCWDYVRHVPSIPPAQKPSDAAEPDQWRCAPKIVTLLTELTAAPGVDTDKRVRDLYGYPEPCTVPQGYDPGDNRHHRSRYDPLKHLYHQYIQPDFRTKPSMVAGCDVDLQVSDQAMLDAMLSPTGRPVP